MNIEIPDEIITNAVYGYLSSHVDVKAAISGAVNLLNPDSLRAEQVVFTIENDLWGIIQNSEITKEYINFLENAGVAHTMTSDSKYRTGDKYTLKILFDEPIKVVDVVKSVSPNARYHNSQPKFTVEENGLRTVKLRSLFRGQEANESDEMYTGRLKQNITCLDYLVRTCKSADNISFLDKEGLVKDTVYLPQNE